MKHLLLLSLLMTLAGCGGGNSTKLEVSKAFAMTNGYYAGGLIVFGESTNGNKFSVALDANLETSLSLANGTWTFYAIGWDGGSFNNKFEGIQHCGATTQEISTSSTVNISVSAGGCSDATFVSAIKPSNIIPSSCGTFYTYDDATNLFSPAVDATLANYCTSLPLQFRSPYTYYRVAAHDKLNGSITTKYLSECKMINADILNLPTAKIPLTIQKFKTNTECLSGTANHFLFPNGIEPGNDQNFEHKLLAGKLLLPSSKTRRGSSPFMNMLPRILCGTSGSYSDCFADIDTLTNQVVVPWGEQNGGDLLLFKNTTANSCPANVLDNAKYFNASNCTLREKNIYASVGRNELTCQPVTSSFTGILDIYSANDNIYILKDNGANDSVQIYNFKGQKQADVPLNISDASKIAVNSNSIFVLTPGAIKRFDFGGVSQGTTSIVADDIDVSPDGTKLAVALPFAGQVTVYTYDANSLTSIDTFSGGSAASPFKIAYDQAFVYVLNPPTGNIKKFPVDAGGILAASSVVGTVSGAENIMRSVVPNEFFVKVSDSSVRRLTSNGSVLAYLTGAGAGTNIAVTDATSFKFFISSASSLEMYEVIASTLSLYSNHTGECSDTHSIASGGNTQTLNYRTKFNTAYQSYAEALKFLGRRTISQIDDASYIFPDLSHDKDEVKTGGMLDLVQSDLSSTGIFGLLGKDYPTCDSLKTKVSDGSIVTASRNIYLPDKMENVQVSLSAKKSFTALPTYICVDADPSGAGCAGGSVYDLDLSFTVTHASSNEKGRVQLLCNKKLGSFETLNLDEGSDTSRELYVWNTENDTKARFESYEIKDEGAFTYRASIAKLQKSAASNFLARQVSVESKPASTNFYGSAVELQRITSSPDKLLTKRSHYSETDHANFFATHGTPAASTTFTSMEAPSCGSVSASIFSTHIPSCMFAGTIPTSSKGLVLNLDTFNDTNQTPLRSVFSIP